MKRALILQHMDHDHAGRFLDFFAEDGIHPETVRVFEGEQVPPLAPYDLMFVLGGAQDTWEEDKYPYLADEKAVIREWVGQRAKPYFGVCLGHQLLAEAMGGSVGKADASEVGLYDVELTSAGRAHKLLDTLGHKQPVMQWHFAEVKQAPKDAVVLAKSPSTAIQVMAIGDHAASTQFHCEFTPQTLAGWKSLPTYIAALEREKGEGAYNTAMLTSLPVMPAMHANTRMMWNNFKAMSGLMA